MPINIFGWSDRELRRYIEINLIAFFAEEFRKAITSFSEDTNIPGRFHLNMPGWVWYAGPLSNTQWMRDLGVQVTEADLAVSATICQLRELIFHKLRPHAQLLPCA